MVSSNLYDSARAQWITYVCVFGALALIPVFVGNAFLLNQISVFGIYGMLAMAIAFCWGTGGILNLGQGIAFGLGSYGMAMTMQMQAQNPQTNPMPSFMATNGLHHLPWFWQPFSHTGLGIFLALAVPTLVSMVFGGLMFRSRVSGPFFAIMSLAVLSAIHTVVVDVQAYTNGSNGISPPASLKIFGDTLNPYSSTAYWLVYSFLATLTLLAKVLTQSKFGQVVRALKDDPERVRFLGYNVALYETLVYTISSFMAAVAGCCFALLMQYVSPGQFDVTFSVSMVIWAGIGGRYSLLGAMIGAVLIHGSRSYLGDTFLNTWELIQGLMFIVIVRFLPSGLAGLLEIALSKFGARKPRGGGLVSPAKVATSEEGG